MRKDYYENFGKAMDICTKHKKSGFDCAVEAVFPRDEMYGYGYRWVVVFR